MKEQELKNLKESIELRMHELGKLQKLYNAETGQDYLMPLYLEKPKKPVINLYEFSVLAEISVIVASTSSISARKELIGMEAGWKGVGDFVGIKDIDLVDVRDIQMDADLEELAHIAVEEK